MKLNKKIQQFQVAYELLVEFFMNKKYSIPVYLYKDMIQLVILLDLQKINIHTFLIANFRMFDKVDGVRYPYIRYMLHNTRSVRLYEEHHKIHGDTAGLINYSRVLSIMREMKSSSHLWHSMEDFTIEERISMMLPSQPDVFKHYISVKYHQFQYSLTFEKYPYFQSIVDIVPYQTLDMIFDYHLKKTQTLCK